eukprot:COSAG04_NODE_497_length_13410_cov_6.004658_11_plen_216_part_00
MVGTGRRAKNNWCIVAPTKTAPETPRGRPPLPANRQRCSPCPWMQVLESRARVESCKREFDNAFLSLSLPAAAYAASAAAATDGGPGKADAVECNPTLNKMLALPGLLCCYPGCVCQSRLALQLFGRFMSFPPQAPRMPAAPAAGLAGGSSLPSFSTNCSWHSDYPPVRGWGVTLPRPSPPRGAGLVDWGGWWRACLCEGHGWWWEGGGLGRQAG